jgi:electron transfer flavoprotein alpha subunit
MIAPLLVFIEQRDGVIHPGSLQLFTTARQIQQSRQYAVEAIVVGNELGSVTERVRGLGADVIHVLDHAEMRHYRAATYAAAVSRAIEQIKPQVVLLATTFMGRDLAPRIAVRTGAGLATDCHAIAVEGETIRVGGT